MKMGEKGQNLVKEEEYEQRASGGKEQVLMETKMKKLADDRGRRKLNRLL